VGEVLDKGTILIEKGKIAAIGKDIEVPFDARVIDASGKVVFPGLVHAHTWRGLDVANEARPVTPQLDAYDAIDPSQLFFEDCLRLGVTTVHVIQANNTVIGGLGRVVRPIGMSVNEMTVAEGEFLKISVTPRSDYERMLQMASLREAFLELDDYLDRLAEQRYEENLKKEKKEIDVLPAEARKRGKDLIRAEDVDDQHKNLLRLRGGQVRVAGQDGPTLFKPLGAFLYCGNAMDVAPAAQLAKDNGFFHRAVFVIGGETYKAVAELKAAARPVVLPPDLVYREVDQLTGDVKETFVPKKIADAGLQYAIVPSLDDSLSERMMTYQAARLVRSGIARDEAIRAITINPAKILGLEKRVGSLEVGKDANIAIYSGDPLDYNSVVEKVLIDGILAYEREKDPRIQRLLSKDATSGGGKSE
jgi:imidazolonepropionase-like amidohydrolase